MKSVLLTILIIAANISIAQKITIVQKQELKKIENEIKNNANEMVAAEEAIDRYRADSLFTRGLVRALRTPSILLILFQKYTHLIVALKFLLGN